MHITVIGQKVQSVIHPMLCQLEKVTLSLLLPTWLRNQGPDQHLVRKESGLQDIGVSDQVDNLFKPTQATPTPTLGGSDLADAGVQEDAYSVTAVGDHLYIFQL